MENLISIWQRVTGNWQRATGNGQWVRATSNGQRKTEINKTKLAKGDIFKIDNLSLSTGSRLGIRFLKGATFKFRLYKP